jgi:hypothetical protein
MSDGPKRITKAARQSAKEHGCGVWSLHLDMQDMPGARLGIVSVMGTITPERTEEVIAMLNRWTRESQADDRG